VNRYYNMLNDQKIELEKSASYLNNIRANNVFIPILLTTTNATITEYGVYSDYIPSGFYICKILDYTSQCSLEKSQISKCSNQYTYIGMRYQDLFRYIKLDISL